ncbi:MAG TPA: hypothetical protein VKT81_03650 [Bryobacteraceae bacterium]|nr:hypothetical protein [Bryobacteraceae bacterium]
MRTLLILIGTLSLAYGDEQAKETIRQTLPGAARLEVDNVHGYIHVAGYNGSEIQVVAEKTIEAESSERMEAAKREVKLDVSRAGDTVTLYVDGPFRCHCDDGRWGVHESGHRGYNVVFDFDIKVPAATFLRLGTVNRGDVHVENTTGDFDIGNVNRGIDLTEVAGSGRVHTVNGPIHVSFAKNPASSCSFGTVNGSIETSFRPNLNADVMVKTFNGHAYTDYDVTALPRKVSAGERRDGKFVYKSNDFNGMRVGNGGPELKYDTLNGNIQIINRGK